MKNVTVEGEAKSLINELYKEIEHHLLLCYSEPLDIYFFNLFMQQYFPWIVGVKISLKKVSTEERSAII